MTAAVNRAYEYLRAGILSGDLPAGARLRETELAEKAGVSRTPIREAIRRLGAEGLVHVEPRLGAVVREWSREEIEEIFSLRALLESRVAARAALRARAEDVAELKRLAQSMADVAARSAPQSREAGREKIGRLNALFHRKLMDMAGSERLTAMVSQLLDVPLSLRTITRYDPDALARSLNHHFEIVAAITHGDAEWAETVMKAHILAAWRAISSDPAT